MFSYKLHSGFTWFRNLIILLIVCGVFFRFYNLGHKVFWYDEVMTALRISGYTVAELQKVASENAPLSVGTLLERYQSPGDDWNLSQTLKALVAHPEHSPLYYLGVRIWSGLFGHSVTMLRCFSALISLLALPCAYWLGIELFSSPSVAWMGVGMVAISPFHVLYAQEAREYSLWTVMTLVACAAFLRAVNRNRRLDWVLYGVSVALGFYSHLFFGLVWLGHGVFLLLMGRLLGKGRWRGFGGASLLAAVLFGPWLWVLVRNFQAFLANTEHFYRDRLEAFPLFWGLHLSRLFVDFNQGPHPVYLLFVLLAGYGLYYLWCYAPASTSIFVFSVVGVTGVGLIVPDVLIVGGKLSRTARYAIPLLLAVQWAIAYLVAQKLTAPSFHAWQQRRWRLIIGGFTGLAILSCGVSSQQVGGWWIKNPSDSRHDPRVAAQVNKSSHPFVISDADPGRVLALSHLLRPDVQIKLLNRSESEPENGSGKTPGSSSTKMPEIPPIPPTADTVYLFQPSAGLQKAVQTQPQFTLTDAYESQLWKVTVKPQPKPEKQPQKSQTKVSSIPLR